MPAEGGSPSFDATQNGPCIGPRGHTYITGGPKGAVSAMSLTQKEWLGPGEMARRLGVSAKALRVYEREGLIAPHRSEGGWRVYGPVAELLHKVLTLRALGLSLKRIKVLMTEDQASFETVLGLQEEALEHQQRRTEAALGLLRAARCMIAAGKPLSLDDLINLTRETVMPDHNAIRALKAKTDALLTDRDLGDEAQAMISELKGQIERSGKTRAELWEDAQPLFAEAKTLMQRGDTSSEAAKALVRRWLGLVPGLQPPSTPRALEVRAAFRDAMGGAASGGDLPFNPAIFSFVRTVIEGVKERGEL